MSRKDKLSYDERVVADKVADEILTVDDDKYRKRYFFLILLFLICFVFLVSSISFAVFDTYYNGGTKNVIDVGVDVIIDDSDDKDIDKDKDDDKVVDKDKSDNKKPSDKKDNYFVSDDKKPYVPSIDSSVASVFFTFNEGSNYINMKNVLPISDEVGKTLTGDKEYFDFSVSSKLKSKRGSIVYEISILPLDGNTIKGKDVRVYLTEDGKDVSVLKDSVNSFSSLPDSSFHKNAKVLYRKTVSDSYNGDYVFRMWLSSKANVTSKVLGFRCKIVVDAYYKQFRKEWLG